MKKERRRYFLIPPDPGTGKIDELIRATRDGELFLYVNDAIVAIPGLYGLFYKNNEGSAKVVITRRR